jgi:6-pyruvoyl-tetrahydropterin synthase
MHTIIKSYHFYYAHRNEMLVGEKCSRLHGHQAHVTFEVQAMVNPKTGVSILFNDLDKLLGETLVKSFDHYTILYKKDPLCKVFKDNNIEFLEVDFLTSAENMAKCFYDAAKKLGEGTLFTEPFKVISVEFKETNSSIVKYRE